MRVWILLAAVFLAAPALNAKPSVPTIEQCRSDRDRWLVEKKVDGLKELTNVEMGARQLELQTCSETVDPEPEFVASKDILDIARQHGELKVWMGYLKLRAWYAEEQENRLFRCLADATLCKLKA